MIVVFSDYLPWCKKHFKDIEREIFYVEGQDYLHDFYLMTLCKHAVIANSSFGWWGAYLNQNPEKRVVCRFPFFGYSGENSDDLICPEWERISGTDVLPFPDF